MKTHRFGSLRRAAGVLLVAAAASAACGPALAAPAPDSAADSAAMGQARQVAARLAEELARHCPLAGPGDSAAFDTCRQALFGPSATRAQLEARVLWGRVKQPDARLADTSLTQFAPDVLTGMYLPLFMFNGEHRVEWVPGEKLYRIHLRTAFRNRLAPGQFPYPFWHEAEKWSMYQGANEVLFWWHPAKTRIVAGQFTVHGAQPPLARSEPVQPAAFDGRWMWSDAQGHAQPKVTLFDGLFRAENPYIERLDGAYRKLALRLREGQCDQCHVPDNPHKSKRLVLLQTPAHAAGEIQRVLKALQIDRMPLDSTGIEAPLEPAIKKALLEEGEAFAKLVQAAKAWESSAQMASQSQGPQPQAAK